MKYYTKVTETTETTETADTNYDSNTDTDTDTDTDNNADLSLYLPQPSTTVEHPALAGLSSEQHLLYSGVRGLYEDHRLQEAQRRYEIGRLVGRHWKKNQTYGEGVMPKICSALCIPLHTLYRWHQVAARYSPEEFSKLIQTCTCHGNRLTWTHLSHLAYVTARDTYKRLLREVIDNDLTTEQLRKRIREIGRSWVDPPEEPDMNYTHRRLRRARRHVQQNVTQIRILDDILGEVMCLDGKAVPLKVVRELRAATEALSELEGVLFDDPCGIADTYNIFAKQAEDARWPPPKPKMSPEEKRNWKFYEQSIARSEAKRAQEMQEMQEA
jgi:GGDEF domain-containing protein